MKKLLLILVLNFTLASSYALGPYEISFNGERFYKSNEKYQNNAIVAEYESANRNSSNSLILTHVMNKDDPSKIAQGLRSKKSIDVVDIENLKDDDVLVSFIKFDAPNSKVQNNLCRIIRNHNKGGCFVFQYVDTKRMKSQSEGGATLPDFTQLSENLKQMPIEKYTRAVSSPASAYARPGRVHSRWYRRHNARVGRRAYDSYYHNDFHRYHY